MVQDKNQSVQAISDDSLSVTDPVEFSFFFHFVCKTRARAENPACCDCTRMAEHCSRLRYFTGGFLHLQNMIDYGLIKEQNPEERPLGLVFFIHLD